MADEELTTEEAVAEAVTDEAVAEPARELPEQEALAAIVEPYPSSVWSVAADEWVVTVDATEYHDLVAAAHGLGFDTFVDLCAVDYFRRDPRFEVVLTMLSQAIPMRLRIRVGVAGTDPELVTVSDVLPGANFYERETYDLFGIAFTGHPDMTRILMPDDWVGYPLRKDYAVGTVPVQFKDSHKVQ
jgi:NADH-quinone oxidoreductase subunit C